MVVKLQNLVSIAALVITGSPPVAGRDPLRTHASIVRIVCRIADHDSGDMDLVPGIEALVAVVRRGRFLCCGCARPSRWFACHAVEE